MLHPFSQWDKVTVGRDFFFNIHKYTPEIPEPAPSLSRHGAQIGGLRVFYRNQNNCGLLGAYVTASTAV